MCAPSTFVVGPMDLAITVSMASASFLHAEGLQGQIGATNPHLTNPIGKLDIRMKSNPILFT